MSIRSFFGFGKGRKSQSQSSKRSLRMEALEERALLSAAPLSTSEYADLCDQYAEFNLPANMNDLNVITLDLAQGDGLSQLKSAISTAGTTTKSDLIVVRTSDTANTLTYTAAGDELLIDIDASQYGSITIVGLGTKSLTLNANQKCRGMTVGEYADAPTNANLGGLTITNGKGGVTGISGGVSITSGGGLLVNARFVTISNCTISDNTAIFGGGIDSSKYSTLTINNSKISGNTASTYITDWGDTSGSNGGGINSRGVLTVTNSELTGNTAIYGGGILVSESTATLTLTGSTLSGNVASFNGGGIANFGTCTIADCTISNNSSTGSEPTEYNSPGGGGIYNQGTMEVSNSTISGNTSQYAGGGIYNRVNASLTISNSTISSNAAVPVAGGIYSEGSLIVTDSTIARNTTGILGGGIALNGTASGLIKNSDISNNSAPIGGGFMVGGTATLTLTNCKVSENISSGGAAGGSVNEDSRLNVINCLIVNNTVTGTYNESSGACGGLLCEGITTITNSTIANNTATTIGGGILYNNKPIYIYNSIIAGNTAPSNKDISKWNSSSSAVVTGYNNLSSFTGWTGSGNITHDGTKVNFVNFAKGDYRLAAGSQAIDKGSNTYANNAGLTSASSDLSGAQRIVNSTIDIGAYEFQGVVLQGVTYSANDISRLQNFLEQTDKNGQKNGKKLNSNYNKDNPSTWEGVTWTVVDGIKCVSKIDWMNKYLVGSLNVSDSIALTKLDVWGNDLTSLNVLGCTALTDLNCVANELTSLDVSQNTALQNLNCWGNDLTSLDVSKNTALKSLSCYSNQLTSLNVSNNTALIALYCGNNQLTELDVSNNTTLTTLECHTNQLTELDVSNNTALTTLNCSSNPLMELDVSNNAALTTLNCSSNQLSELDVSNNTALTTLNCSSNPLMELDISSCTALTSLECADTQLIELDLSNNTALKTLNCSSNQLSELDLSVNTALTTLRCFSNQLTELNVSNNQALSLLYCYDNPLAELDLLNCPSMLYLSVGDTIQNVYLNLPPENGWIDILVNSSDESSSSDWSFIDSYGNELVKRSRYYIHSTDTLPIYAQNETTGLSIAFSSLKMSSPTLTVQAIDSNSISAFVGEVENATGYTIEYSTSEDFANATSLNVTAGSTIITGLSAETTYYFHVKATFESGDSDYSATATATTLAEPVTADAVVNARVVFQDSLKDVDTAAELPEGISSIRAGKTVYAEIWIKDIEDTDPAIIGGYLNMLYDNAALTVGEVTYGTVFSTLTSNPDVSTAGLIDLIGGGAAQGVLDKGDDEWVRLATVSFDADAEGLTTVSLAAPNDYRDNITRVGGVILTNEQIDFGSAELEIIAACPMDIDGDGYIGMSDYGLLSNAWRSSPGKDNWNPACDIDGDGYVGMSDYAFLSNNWRKYTDDPSLVYPTASASPAAAVSSEIIVDPYNLTAYSDNAIADVRLTAVSTKTASDVADEVPASLTQVAPGDSFFVEIWVRNFNGYDGSNLCGLFGGYLNMSYPSDSLAVGDVTYSSIFPQFNGLQDVSVPGIIDLIGGATAMGVKDKGDDEWVRLATVEFTASATGDVLIESLPPTDSHDNLTLASTTGRLLKNDEIDFGSLNLTIADNVIQLASPTLSASATGSNSVSVTVGSVTNASGYRVEYSTSADFANAVSQNVNAGKTTVSGLNAETTYYFRAMALGTGDYSNSNYSESATATTLPAPVLEAEVNARVVFQDSLKDADTAAELPEGITSIRATKTVYAEIWVKDVEDTDPAIIGGYLNMLYDSDALSVLDVTYGTEICYLTGFQTYENGEIATIGGTTAPSVLDKGDDEWVRLATVSFVADMEGFTTVSLGAPNDYHDNITRTDGRILSNAQIDYGSSVLEVTAACPMDIDGDGYIGVSDYSLLSKAWRSSPGKENWDPACDIDGDGYVGVSDYTFLSKNWRKYADDPDLVYPEANASPAAPVSENVVIASPAAVVSEDNFIEMSNTAALEADETANVLLTAVSTKTASDTADEVPSSLTEINPGDSFFVEIWVRNFNGYEGSNLCGLTGGYLNMSYPEELLNLGDVTYGRVFSQLNNFQDDSQAGFIDLIGGVAGAGVLDKGDNEWVRLATVSFTASENGDALIESLPPTDSHDNLTLTSGRTLKNDEISFGVINLRIGSTVIQLKVNNDFIKTTLNNSVVIAYRENDAVADWSKTTVEFGDASNGEYSVNGNGTITYTPEDGFYGTDAVSYVVVDSSGELSTGAIVISVGLPIATSVQKTSGSHSPSSAMAASVERLTDWDNCCVELWAQDVNALNPGETTFTLSYNPTIYNAPYFSACADGVALSVTDSAALPDGSVEVQLTARVLESLSSQTNNLFLGTVVLTPSMDDGAGVVSPLAAEPVCALDGAETPTTVEAMPYDLIRNGSVDVNDFVAFATVFGYVPGNMSPVNPLYVQTAKSDFNKDGSVNADDFVLFAINFGATKNTADKPAPLASAATELVRSEEFENVELIEAQPELKSSLTLPEAYSAALLDLYDNQDIADLSGSSDVLAKSRMDAQLFDVESDSSHKASSQAIDAVLEEDLLAIDWN